MTGEVRAGMIVDGARMIRNEEHANLEPTTRCRSGGIPKNLKPVINGLGQLLHLKDGGFPSQKHNQHGNGSVFGHYARSPTSASASRTQRRSRTQTWLLGCGKHSLSAQKPDHISALVSQTLLDIADPAGLHRGQIYTPLQSLATSPLHTP
ncbi:hypothetical protein EDD16DRAFT_117440 [Pisolithus croceorrhizus]|nr:hypothetical protein EDD16DRAFT_117440 [Pisolithus croceorrhizus]